jgi:hypothetical protein
MSGRSWHQFVDHSVDQDQSMGRELAPALSHSRPPGAVTAPRTRGIARLAAEGASVRSGRATDVIWCTTSPSPPLPTAVHGPLGANAWNLITVRSQGSVRGSRSSLNHSEDPVHPSYCESLRRPSPMLGTPAALSSRGLAQRPLRPALNRP